GYPDSFRVGDGKFFAIEGDEYDTAYFDKGPKFLHYKPQTAIITSLEFDHADIFDSIDDVERAFQKLIQIMPKNGHLVIWRGAERAVRLARESDFEGKLTIYDSEPGPGVDLWLSDISTGAQGVSFNATYHNESLGHFELPQWGDYSALNGAAILGALIGAGLSPDEVRGPMSTFRGVKRRMEIRGEFDGVTLVDDFGHHPTAIKVTLDGARARFGERRIIAVFEPRSATTRRSVFQKELVDAFLVADRAIIGSHERLGEIDEAERFSPERLVRDLNERGVEAAHIPEVGEIVETLAKTVQSGDVIMVFSNGAFGGLHQKLEATLMAAQEENK
ncbi:UDP-N-acetylmuramate dehydrogenase, partial [Myxococcota bacterium]|nr:UDP-N-acetylmuramate dehydrogenase [Myxococcota bacterium]